MSSAKRWGAAVFTTALVAGLLTTAPQAAFAEADLTTEAPTSVEETSPNEAVETVPADPTPVPETESGNAPDSGTENDATSPTEEQVNISESDSAEESAADTEEATPGAETSRLSVPSGEAFAVTAKCTVKVSLPTTAKSTNYRDPISLTTNAVDCVDSFKLTIRRISDNRILDYWWVSSTDEDYQNGRIDIKIPGSPGFNIPGKYKAEITNSSLDYSWARSNGLDSSKDYPRITYGNNVMDLRSTSRTSFSANRTVGGVTMNGTVTRYDTANDKYIAQSKATVTLQKKVSGSWVTKKTLTTNSAGKFSATVNDAKSGNWRALVQASPQMWAANRYATVVKKSPGKAAVSISRSYDSWYDKFTGSVKFNAGGGYYAAPKGVKIAVQKKSGSSWNTVKTITTNSAGKYTYSTSKLGSYRFLVKGTSQYASKASASKKVSY